MAAAGPAEVKALLRTVLRKIGTERLTASEVRYVHDHMLRNLADAAVGWDFALLALAMRASIARLAAALPSFEDRTAHGMPLPTLMQRAHYEVTILFVLLHQAAVTKVAPLKADVEVLVALSNWVADGVVNHWGLSPFDTTVRRCELFLRTTWLATAQCANADRDGALRYFKAAAPKATKNAVLFHTYTLCLSRTLNKLIRDGATYAVENRVDVAAGLVAHLVAQPVLSRMQLIGAVRVPSAAASEHIVEGRLLAMAHSAGAMAAAILAAAEGGKQAAKGKVPRAALSAALAATLAPAAGPPSMLAFAVLAVLPDFAVERALQAQLLDLSARTIFALPDSVFVTDGSRGSYAALAAASMLQPRPAVDVGKLEVAQLRTLVSAFVRVALCVGERAVRTVHVQWTKMVPLIRSLVDAVGGTLADELLAAGKAVAARFDALLRAGWHADAVTRYCRYSYTVFTVCFSLLMPIAASQQVSSAAHATALHALALLHPASVFYQTLVAKSDAKALQRIEQAVGHCAALLLSGAAAHRASLAAALDEMHRGATGAHPFHVHSDVVYALACSSRAVARKVQSETMLGRWLPAAVLFMTSASPPLMKAGHNMLVAPIMAEHDCGFELFATYMRVCSPLPPPRRGQYRAPPVALLRQFLRYLPSVFNAVEKVDHRGGGLDRVDGVDMAAWGVDEVYNTAKHYLMLEDLRRDEANRRPLHVNALLQLLQCGSPRVLAQVRRHVEVLLLQTARNPAEVALYFDFASSSVQASLNHATKQELAEWLLRLSAKASDVPRRSKL
jgi:hypothetical protein